MSTTFDPSAYITQIKGKDYLEVKWRIFWFREVWPNGNIITELVSHDPKNKTCVIRATVTKIDRAGRVCGIATGYKTGDPTATIGDYLELGETGAIGRALASLGFGTQFAGVEYEEDESSIADAPVRPGIAPSGGQGPRLQAVPDMTRPPGPNVDRTTGEITPEAAPDPNAIIDAQSAQDLKDYAKWAIDQGFTTPSGIQTLMANINRTATKLTELTYEEAAQLEGDIEDLAQAS